MSFIIRWLIIVAVFGGFIFYINKQDRDKERETQDRLAPYNAMIDRYLTKKSIATARLPAKGRFIFIDAKTRTVDTFSDFTMNPHSHPQNPNEVDSVVLHDCDYVQVGSYTNDSKAMQHVCNFTVIDVPSGTWSNWGEFKGAMPAGEIRRRRGGSSDERGGRAIYPFIAAGGLGAMNSGEVRVPRSDQSKPSLEGI